MTNRERLEIIERNTHMDSDAYAWLISRVRVLEEACEDHSCWNETKEDLIKALSEGESE